MNIYCGNLNYRTEEDALKQLFEEFGKVSSVKIIEDRDTGKKKGFGFVEMETGGQKAIDALNDTEFDSRILRVNEAKPREPRTGGRY